MRTKLQFTALPMMGGVLLALLGAFGLAACQAEGDPPSLRPTTMGPSVELLELGDELFRQGEYDEAKRLYARAVNANGPNHAYVEACAQVARMESLSGNMAEGEVWLGLGQRRAHVDDPLGWSRMQMVIGIFERESGSPERAVLRFTDLYQYCLSHELHDRAIDVAHHVVLASDDPEVQMLWSQKGIEAAEAGGLHGWLAVLWNNKGASLEGQGRWEEALIAYLTAREYHIETGNQQRILIANWAVARAQRQTGDLLAARALSTENLRWAERRYTNDPSADNAEWVGYCIWEIAELEALDGQFELAVVGLKLARQKLLEARIENWGQFGRTELARLDLRLRKVGEAVEAQE